MYYEVLASEFMHLQPCFLQPDFSDEDRVLLYLLEHGRKVPVTELSSLLADSSAPLGPILGKLERNGCIVIPDKSTVELTAHGAAHSESVYKRRLLLITTLFEQLGPHDASEIVRLHKALSAHYQEAAALTEQCYRRCEEHTPDHPDTEWK